MKSTTLVAILFFPALIVAAVGWGWLSASQNPHTRRTVELLKVGGVLAGFIWLVSVWPLTLAFGLVAVISYGLGRSSAR